MREADVELSQEYALHEDASGICKWLVCDVMGPLVLLLYVCLSTRDVCLSVHACCMFVHVCCMFVHACRMFVCPHVMYVCLSTCDVCLSVHS